MSYTIPDLRFEQGFMRQLNNYAGNKQEKKKHSLFIKKNYDPIPQISDAELKKLNQNLDEEEEDYLEKPEPLFPITPNIVIYALIKDQIIMPLLQGFFWTGLLISIRPFLGLIVKQGQYAGHWASSLLGLNRLAQPRGRFSS
ncbi:uncharacterized protein KGF55_001311 [Candida pseudojiufengensis]|uniref:uncharacterized protein n=1 Tax=Candida pseudojiufengensis TaxID=497109 RepID=UPI002224622D|nr:uncharacterized protein KGF55_001311 [Candida pseudojiufengensis]KAI5965947.1 hypothetical protein KGF55_001311 [Candida pseudojiufengensis]